MNTTQETRKEQETQKKEGTTELLSPKAGYVQHTNPLHKYDTNMLQISKREWVEVK